MPVPTISRLIILIILCVATLPVDALPFTSSSTSLEQLNWSDPRDALRQLPATPDPADLSLQEVIAMVYFDAGHRASAQAILSALQARAQQGNAPAALAAHFIRAYRLFAEERYNAANAELASLPIETGSSAEERYRLHLLRAHTLLRLGQTEAAGLLFAEALKCADALNDDPRRLQAYLGLASLHLDTDQLARARRELDVAQRLATTLGDEAALSQLERVRGVLASKEGDHVAEELSGRAALHHADLAHSERSRLAALIDLSDMYLKLGQFERSLRAAAAARVLIATTSLPGRSQLVLFNEGLAELGLRHQRIGTSLIERALKQLRGADDQLELQEMLREYADALARAGRFAQATRVYGEYTRTSETVLANVRKRSFDLSTRIETEQQSRKLAELQRKVEHDTAQMHAQRLQKQIVVLIAAASALVSLVLLWAIYRIRRANAQLRISSEHDPLTGLGNRRYFNEHVRAAHPLRQARGCVLLADLDHFKRINDEFGHPAGDAVLQTVSQRLAAALREGDELVRWGGEEFLAILSSLSAEQAERTVERLLETVRLTPVQWLGHAIPVTISIGYGIFPGLGTDQLTLDSAITLVDQALYEAKRRGRNQSCATATTSASREREIIALQPKTAWPTADCEAPQRERVIARNAIHPHSERPRRNTLEKTLYPGAR